MFSSHSIDIGMYEYKIFQNLQDFLSLPNNGVPSDIDGLFILSFVSAELLGNINLSIKCISTVQLHYK